MFFERPDAGETAVLVHVDFHDEQKREDPGEFLELVRSAGAEPATLLTASRHRPDSRTFIGSGKLEELRALLAAHEAELVIFNHSLSPSQERNVEQELKCRVLDRTGLILDIFAQRARTHEGKLQVELAQLEYMSTRLVRGWTHLERQKGGIGLRGPGETQLETDRRLLRGRIKSIHKRLDKVRSQRDQNRRARARAEIHSVSLVGYTNAGKSTLFNALTNSEVYAADQLFATLDPTLRRLEIEDVGPVVMADTVGFIRHLPHKLVEAFQATLQEASEASLLVHVIDAADPDRELNVEQVELVLKEIGADDVPVLKVMNKIDKLDSAPRIERDGHGVPEVVWLSAQQGQGLELLHEALTERLANDVIGFSLTLTPEQGKLRAGLHELNAVREEAFDEQGHSVLDVRLPRRDFNQLMAQLGERANTYLPEALRETNEW
ncbi:MULTISPECIES: ribosome rescue GTPase HflX [Halomonadaceae]|uniref:GTPase HflX n=1 Tax=Vreelandella titanicae BH1 TaxID=1204738 RepID=L9U8A8_9GAMM|nr:MULTISPECIES: ribosome rescue GTPase HflX [Halomonas]NAO97424.1 GTPase HflX [Halomonas sp. MG34]QGQ70151.1 GTPase HflX [Halomonas sp. PA16-9]UEQ05884.1 GTPase HflX [Halomonas profundus]ELY21074.1 GTP-binding protein, HflX [Halomonas titanicae BH1]MCD1585394.1 GTPase HflX [Halomonas sp. IOP_14]